MNSRNMIRVAVLGMACLAGTIAVRAQAAAGSASAGKIAVINVRQAIVSTAEGKQASAELQSQFAPRGNELEALNKADQRCSQPPDRGTSTLSDEEKQRLQQQGERLATQLSRKSRMSIRKT